MHLMERLRQIPELVQVAPDLWERNKTKLARHTTKNAALARYIRSDKHLEEWQQVQREPVFHRCKFIIGFRGLDNREARMVGVYKNISGNTPQPQTIERLVADGCIPQPLANVLLARSELRYFYDLQKVWDARELLPEPLKIKWSNTPQGAISWHQWAHLRQKTIIESRR